MKTILLQASNNDQAWIFMSWFGGAIIGTAIVYFLFRWIFGVDKRIKQNEAIIELLKKISSK